MNEIDEIMRLDPLELSAYPGGVDKVIEWHRLNRARAESGVKPKKAGKEETKIDLVQLGLIEKPPALKRRV